MKKVIFLSLTILSCNNAFSSASAQAATSSLQQKLTPAAQEPKKSEVFPKALYEIKWSKSRNSLYASRIPESGRNDDNDPGFHSLAPYIIASALAACNEYTHNSTLKAVTKDVKNKKVIFRYYEDCTLKIMFKD